MELLTSRQREPILQNHGYEPHGEPGHLNVERRDHDSVVTAFGRHDRVIACQPRGDQLYCRVDHLWNLDTPTCAEVLAVARSDRPGGQGVRGDWRFERAAAQPDGSATDYFFRRHTPGRDSLAADGKGGAA